MNTNGHEWGEGELTHHAVGLRRSTSRGIPNIRVHSRPQVAHHWPSSVLGFGR
jgi:hypothetical protein